MALTIAVIGSVMADIVVETPHLPRKGQNLYVPRMDVSAGGKGANAAITLARHGATAHLISNSGADALGDQVRAALAESGVHGDLIGRHPEEPTGMVIIFAEPDGAATYVAHPAASQTVTAAEVTGRLGPLLPDLDALYFNLEAPEAALLAAVEMVEEAQIPYFVDAGPPRPYRPRLWRHAELISPNELEAAALVGHALTDLASMQKAAQALLEQGPRAVVLKLGERGAFWATGAESGVAPAFPIEAIDSAGAGDAFTAGLVWALLSAEPLPEAVRWANGCGALAASRFGTAPALPARGEVAAFLARSL